MRIFCHVNELRAEGCRQVRTMIAAFETAVLWGPSFKYFESVAANDPLAVAPDELLEHIGHGRVRVIARDWWLTDRPRRDALATGGNWEGYAWHKLDDELRRMYLADQGKDAPRVLGLDDGVGLETIQRVIEERQLDPMTIAKSAARELPGYQDKANADLSIAGLSLIKDAYNHGNAFRASGADRNLGVPRDQYLYEVFAEQAGGTLLDDFVSGAARAPDVSTLLDSLQPFIERVQAIGAPPSDAASARGRFNNLFGDQHALTQFRSFVEEADRLVECGVSTTLDELLRDQLAAALSNSAWEKIKDVAARLSLRHLVSIGLTLLNKYVGSDAVTRAADDLARRGALIESRKRLPPGYAGPIWPIYFVADERDPSEDARLIRTLLEALTER